MLPMWKLDTNYGFHELFLKCKEDEIIQMLDFLIDNIFVQFGGRMFQQTIGIPMGTNCAPQVNELFLHAYEADFFQELLKNKDITIVHTTNTQKYVSYLDPNLEISNGGRLKTKLYDKRDDFTFLIVNFPFIRNHIQLHLRMEFTFHNSYVIIGRVHSTGILWAEHSCWRKSYSNKTRCS